MIRVRPAEARDAAGLGRALDAIVAATGRGWWGTADEVRADYVDHPDRVACLAAEDGDGTIVGFQSLQRAGEGDRYDVPAGWGVVGTHGGPLAWRQGVGTAHFGATRPAAAQEGLGWIDATVARDDPRALAFYEARGFRTYLATDRTIRTSIRVGMPEA